jgi:hypothetical protein
LLAALQNLAGVRKRERNAHARIFLNGLDTTGFPTPNFVLQVSEDSFAFSSATNSLWTESTQSVFVSRSFLCDLEDCRIVYMITQQTNSEMKSTRHENMPLE